ncbi:zinc finger, CCHC-type containing protein, partial [Tanacetum coccineum]
MDAAAMKHMTSNFAKLDKFEGVDFIRWQKKMHFLLSTVSVVYVLTTHIPEDGGDDATVKQIRKRNKWDNDDYVCRGLILKDFKHTLKNKKDELTLVKLDSHLRIEESLRAHDSDKPKGNNVAAFMSTSELNYSIIWHARLGHVHFKRMQDMSKDGLIPTFDMDTEKCKTCMLTKITKKQFQNVKRETEVLELIHIDLCDLHATPSLGNKKHFVTFIDDAFMFCYVYLLHSKDEALDKFKVFKTEVEFQQGSQIKRVRTDRGGLSQGFWGEAMLTACYLLHRVNQMMRWTPLWATTLGGWLIYLQGFKQKSRIDYFDTYAPVVRISAIRLLIVMASIHNLIIHQMDVKTTFLNGDLDEEVYMNQPQGFIMPGNENK